MKTLRFTVIALFALLVAFIGFGSHAAQTAPAAAMLCAGITGWMGFLLCTPTNQGLVCALSAASALKLDTILRNAITALEKRLSPILALSTVMRDMQLTETNIVQVPFYALETMTSKNFDGSYNFASGDGTVAARPVTVDKRKYQTLEFTSKELRRNSAVDLGKVMALKVDKLASDVLDDIWSAVTAANYSTAIFTGAASGFDRDDVVDLGVTVSQANWPATGRSLILESAYIGALAKDLNAVDTMQGDNVRTEGSVGRAGGFAIFEHPNMPGNSENLVGAAVLPYGLLAAFSPIEPSDEVRDNLSDYKIITGKSGLSLEYRSWGDPDSDTAKRVMELNYGYAKGDAAQIKRLVSA